VLNKGTIKNDEWALSKVDFLKQAAKLGGIE
jgi:hypothetical protein